MEKIKLVFITIALGFLYSCLNYEQVTTIKTDNSGEMYLHYWIKWNSPKDSLVLMNLEIFNQDSIYNQFTSAFTIINDLQVYRNFEDSTIHAKIEFEFSQFDSLNLLSVFKGREFSIKDGPENTKVFSQAVPIYTAGWGAQRELLKITYIYYLPGEIIKHNADNLSNNKLIWNFGSNPQINERYITATYRPFKLKETPRIIFISALAILFVVIIYLFKRKK
ncbi:MAG: hypothetical protein A2V66_16585 [Ignavibacteria bacterium RBG_13_36_8]|nr:MAG: hypothetical protein A2V66_16585 [Ignavibacteria bacterium RBG_13_36_8]